MADAIRELFNDQQYGEIAHLLMERIADLGIFQADAPSEFELAALTLIKTFSEMETARCLRLLVDRMGRLVTLAEDSDG